MCPVIQGLQDISCLKTVGHKSQLFIFCKTDFLNGSWYADQIFRKWTSSSTTPILQVKHIIRLFLGFWVALSLNIQVVSADSKFANSSYCQPLVYKHQYMQAFPQFDIFFENTCDVRYVCTNIPVLTTWHRLSYSLSYFWRECVIFVNNM